MFRSSVLIEITPITSFKISPLSLLRLESRPQLLLSLTRRFNSIVSRVYVFKCRRMEMVVLMVSLSADLAWFSSLWYVLSFVQFFPCFDLIVCVNFSPFWNWWWWQGYSSETNLPAPKIRRQLFLFDESGKTIRSHSILLVNQYLLRPNL